MQTTRPIDIVFGPTPAKLAEFAQPGSDALSGFMAEFESAVKNAAASDTAAIQSFTLSPTGEPGADSLLPSPQPVPNDLRADTLGTTRPDIAAMQKVSFDSGLQAARRSGRPPPSPATATAVALEPPTAASLAETSYSETPKPSLPLAAPATSVDDPAMATPGAQASSVPVEVAETASSKGVATAQGTERTSAEISPPDRAAAPPPDPASNIGFAALPDPVATLGRAAVRGASPLARQVAEDAGQVRAAPTLTADGVRLPRAEIGPAGAPLPADSPRGPELLVAPTGKISRPQSQAASIVPLPPVARTASGASPGADDLRTIAPRPVPLASAASPDLTARTVPESPALPQPGPINPIGSNSGAPAGLRAAMPTVAAAPQERPVLPTMVNSVDAPVQSLAARDRTDPAATAQPRQSATALSRFEITPEDRQRIAARPEPAAGVAPVAAQASRPQQALAATAPTPDALASERSAGPIRALAVAPQLSGERSPLNPGIGNAGVGPPAQVVETKFTTRIVTPSTAYAGQRPDSIRANAMVPTANPPPGGPFAQLAAPVVSAQPPASYGSAQRPPPYVPTQPAIPYAPAQPPTPYVPAQSAALYVTTRPLAPNAPVRSLVPNFEASPQAPIVSAPESPAPSVDPKARAFAWQQAPDPIKPRVAPAEAPLTTQTRSAPVEAQTGNLPTAQPIPPQTPTAQAAAIVSAAAPEIRSLARPDPFDRTGRSADVSPEFADELGRSLAAENAPREAARPATEIRLPRQVAIQLADIARQLPDRPVELTLNPEELGRVKMTLNAGDGSISVSLAIERVETADLLRRNIDLLSEEFRKLGYSEISFDFSGGDPRGQGDPDASAAAPQPTAVALEHADDTAPSVPAAPTDGMDIRL